MFSRPKEETLLTDLINNFQIILSTHKKSDIIAMWYGNPRLRTFYFGQPVNFGTVEEPILYATPFDHLIDYFKSVLSSHCTDVIVDIWRTNPWLRAFYFGQPVNFGTVENPVFQAISSNTLIENFKSVLPSHCTEVIMDIWELNPQLRALYFGQLVNLGTVENPAFQTISSNALIENFKFVLSSQELLLIYGMWDNNINLQTAIKNLGPGQAELLLKKVLSSNKHGKSDFITQYVAGIKNRELLSEVLKSIKTRNGSVNCTNYISNKIELLENRIAQLSSSNLDSQPIKSDTGFELFMDSLENSEFTASVTQPAKRQRISYDPVDISDVLEKMPSPVQIGEKYPFPITSTVSATLKKLPKSTLNDMGIYYIKKNKLAFFNTELYKNFYNRNKQLDITELNEPGLVRDLESFIASFDDANKPEKDPAQSLPFTLFGDTNRRKINFVNYTPTKILTKTG